MVYECDQCEATLSPLALACPRCRQKFDTPVPADAEIARGFTAVSAALHPLHSCPLPAAPMRDDPWLAPPIILSSPGMKKAPPHRTAGDVRLLSQGIQHRVVRGLEKMILSRGQGRNKRGSRQSPRKENQA